MHNFDDCTETEKQVMNDIMNGKAVDECDTEIVKNLLKKNILDNSAGYITVSAIVWSLWKKEND